LATLTTVMEVILSVAVSPDGRTLAVGGGGWHQPGRVELWDSSRWAEVPRPRAVLRGHRSWVWSLAFSPDGHTVATGGNDQHIRFFLASGGDWAHPAPPGRPGEAKLWDAATGQELVTLSEPGNVVFAVAFSPDGATLATANYDATAKLWDVAALVRYGGR
jgi:WD40 repeat protein